MDFIFEWCFAHLDLIISVGFGLVEFFILIIFRRRVKIQEFVLQDSSFNNRVLDLVKAAEDLFGAGKGKEKLDYVIKNMCASVPGATKSFTEAIVKARVEQILSTPQKKGV